MALVEVILFVLAFTQTTQANGVVEIKAVRYSATCTDNWILRTPCDTFFEFCLKKSTGRSDALQPCDYGSYGPTNHYDDTNNIDFTTRTSFAGGISNPLKFEVRSFDNFDIKIVISVRDDEAKGSEHLAWLAKEFRHSPAKTEQLSSWSETLTASSGNYRFQFKFRSYCIANYYTSSCNVYCLAQDNASGHYTCNQTTGAKVCMPGWTGPACDIDIDECAQGICHNGANCTNLPGSYKCECPENFVGKKCDLVYSLCYSKPCLNNGNCTGTTSSFNCTCNANWTGDTCQTMVNFCQSLPCLHGATCDAIVGAYSCRCAKGWTGENCQTEVDACRISPCLNNGTCQKEAGGEYTCRCSADYWGTNCEKYLDPCLSSPCNPAPVAGSQTATLQDDKTLDPVPIVLAVCGSFLLVVIIVVVLLIVRRRRKKMETADVAHFSIREVHCESDPSVAFDNDLYRHVNTANACLDESRRQKQDVAHPPGCEDDVCNPATPLDEEMGAVGGVEHAYQDIDSCKVLLLKGGGRKEEAETSLKKASPAGQSSDAGVGTFGQAQSDERVRGNPYEDFEELKRQSRVQRSQEEASLNSSWGQGRPEVVTQPENPYHDLDEVRLEVEAMQSHILYSIPRPTAAQPPPLPPLPPALAAREIALQTNGDDEVTRGEGDDSSDDGEEEAVEQEDINQLRQEVLLARGRGKSDATSKC